MVMVSTLSTFMLIIFLSALGGLFKILGGFIGGSKSVFVDALTSIANTLAVVMMYKFFSASVEPPDEDHHYGHHRMGLGGPISTLLLYSFVTGVIVVDLYRAFDEPYAVSMIAPALACMGLLPYSLAMFLAKHVSSSAVYYIRFTSVEVIESAVTIITAFAGAIVSYLIDFIGAIALTSYLFIELTKSFREILMYVSDTASKDIVRGLQSILSNRGIVAERIRVRKVAENLYQGDVVVKLSPSISIEKAHQIVDSVERDAREKLNVEITIHIEPESKGG